MKGKYWIYWIDKYNVAGYRSGVSHGLIDGERYSLCGLDCNRMDVDGGYINTIDDEASIECKKCLKKIEKNEDTTLNTK